MRLPICMLALAAMCMSSALADDVAMYRGGPEGVGIYTGRGPKRTPEVLWTFATKGAVVSTPVVAGGRVYVGSGDSTLYGLDASTGQCLWTYMAKGAIDSSPALAGGLLYFTSRDGMLHAVDAAKGTLLWSMAMPGEKQFSAVNMHGTNTSGRVVADPWDMYLSSPCVADGTLYVGSGSGQVYAVDATSGTPKWTFAAGDVVHARPAAAKGYVYVGSWDGRLTCLDAASGQERWHFQGGQDPKYHNQQGIQSSPAIADGKVVLGGRDAHVYALDAETGTIAWRKDYKGSWVIQSPAIKDGVVYVGTSDSCLFEAMDLATGKTLWSTKQHAYGFSSPLWCDGLVYFGQFDGTLSALDAATGKTVWEWTTQGHRDHPEYLRPDGQLNQAKIFTGSTWDDMLKGYARLYELGAILGSPVIHDGTIYVTSTDGRVYALR